MSFHFSMLAAIGPFLLGPAQAAAPAGRPADTFSPMIIMFAVLALFFYLIVLSPQKKEQKKRQKMLDEVQRGDRAVTVGGIHGTVEAVNVSKATVSLLIAPKVTVEVNRSALSAVTPKGSKASNKEDADTADKA